MHIESLQADNATLLALIRELADGLTDTLAIVPPDMFITERTPAIDRRSEIKDRANALIARAREAAK